MNEVNFILPKISGEYRFNFNLAQLTWFKVGGNAEVFFKPLDIADLQKFLSELDPSVPITVLGNCSNVIIRDGGIKGVVIKLGRNFANIHNITNNLIFAGSGALNSSVSTYCLNNSLGNLEFLSGIPGSIGGGIRMNAGAYGSEFKNYITEIEAVNRQGLIVKFSNEEANFSYRNCSLNNDLIFTGAYFKVISRDKDEIKKKINEITANRTSSQPVKEKTGGSTFANPLNNKAWQLIDEVGLRGYRIGDAEFSNLHCNFLINNGNATAKNLEDLGNLAIEKVMKEKNIELKWEIKRLGFYD